MPYNVQVNTPYKNVELPNGHLYDGTVVVTLADEEYTAIAATAFSSGILTDLGSVTPASSPTVTTSVTASTALSGHRIVVAQTDGTVIYADNTNINHISLPKWQTLGAASAGASVSVLLSGMVLEPSWSWTPNYPIWLGTNGVMVQTIPVAPARFLVQVAMAITATYIHYNPQMPIAL